MRTPWGQSDGKHVLAQGIVSYSTPGHGGIRLSPERQAQLPQGIRNFLGSYEWWEEDCDWSVPYLHFAAEINDPGYKESNLEAAQSIAAHYHPEYARRMND